MVTFTIQLTILNHLEPQDIDVQGFDWFGSLLLLIDPPPHTHIIGHYHLETTWLPVNNDWYGEGEDEDAAESAQAAD